MAEFSIPTRSALLKHKRDQQELGYTITLAATSMGLAEPIVARIQRLSMLDRSTLEGLPVPVQETVWEGLKDLQKEQKRLQDEGIDPETLLDGLKNNERMLKAADPFCVAAFIEPRLVATERELQDTPDAWVVTDVSPEDRLNVFIVCADAESEQAKKLKLFRPRSVIDVQHHEVVPAAPAAVRDLGSEERGLQPVGVPRL